MKNPLQIFELTQRDQRAVVLIMIVLLIVAFAQRYRHAHPQSPPSLSGTASAAPPHAKDEQPTTNNRH
jgi:hypothetical protein